MYFALQNSYPDTAGWASQAAAAHPGSGGLDLVAAQSEGCGAGALQPDLAHRGVIGVAAPFGDPQPLPVVP
ncbi:hypothetical protein ACFC1R_38500 [Kitasatospora sp. NPDC056138]|uniref:hypothetical protein n=1 Tax=Kitasatospora sp. NPDC056138 TaxID=3345724 RepID=UPI0035E29690